MKKVLMSFFICFFFGILVFAQNTVVKPIFNKKGTVYLFWGWNRASFGNSNIHFTGQDYDFELSDVVAHDRQSEFSADLYLNIGKMTIPQYNFRLGYFLHDNYSISIGADHMKYVVDIDQVVKINGRIANSGGDYDGIYDKDEVQLKQGFLELEHTDGLNFFNIDFRRHDEVLDLDKIKISLSEGIGVGLLFPKTNASLLGNDRSDAYHLSGFGLNGVLGININFFKHFFIQPEIKGGYVNMPDVKTTKFDKDKASQSFLFFQRNVVIGAVFKLGK